MEKTYFFYPAEKLSIPENSMVKVTERLTGAGGQTYLRIFFRIYRSERRRMGWFFTKNLEGSLEMLEDHDGAAGVGRALDTKRDGRQPGSHASGNFSVKSNDITVKNDGKGEGKRDLPVQRVGHNILGEGDPENPSVDEDDGGAAEEELEAKTELSHQFYGKDDYKLDELETLGSVKIDDYMDVDNEEDNLNADREPQKPVRGSKRKKEIVPEMDQHPTLVRKAKYVKDEEGNTATAEERKQVYLINLSFSIDDKTVTETFRDCGEIEAIKWEEENGRFAGRGWVRFKEEAAADKAAKMTGTKVMERPIIVRKASDVYCNRIYVRNLPQSATESELRKFFADAGAITEVKWIEDRNTGTFKGSGFVQFTSIAEGKRAVKKHGSMFMGKKITCEFSRPLKDEPNASRASTPGPADRQDRFPKTRVFISNLDYNIDEATVTDFFRDCGPIRNIRWSEKNGEFFCKGVVEFESPLAAQKAVAKSGQMLMGKTLNAEISNPPGRKKTAENTIFVGNLPFDATEDEIRSFAEGCGAIKSVRTVKDRLTHRPKGYGFVEFFDKESAANFVKDKAGAQLRGRPVRLREMFESGSSQNNG